MEEENKYENQRSNEEERLANKPDNIITNKSKKEWKKNLIVLLVTIIIMLVLLEIFLRFFYPQKLYDECYEYSYKNLSNLEVDLDPVVGWSTKKDYSGCAYQPDTNKKIFKTHNLKGVRLNKEIPYEKGNKKRVILLGDSFAYGFGLNDSDTIAIRLQENLGEEYEVIPLGVNGYGTGQEILSFKHEGLKYKPDIVILFLFINDFANTQQIDQAYGDKPIIQTVKQIQVSGIDASQKMKVVLKELSKDPPQIKLFKPIINSEETKNSKEISDETIITFNYPTKMIWNKNYGDKKAPLSEEKPFSSLLLKYSHLYSLIYHKMSKLKSSPKKTKYSERISDGVDVFTEKEFNTDANNGMFLISELFSEMEKLAKKNNFKFIVINIPDKRNVNEKYQKKFLSQYPDADESFFDFKKVDNIFNESLPNRKIEYISLFNFAEENFDGFYFNTDPHWNPTGVKLSADYITQELKNKKII